MKTNKINYVMLTVGLLICLWVGSAVVSAMLTAGGVGALVTSYMTATGLSASFATLVEYYTYIKGIEYLICVAFFVAFPVFYNFVNTEKTPQKVTA